jgi:hypothetical protein
VVGGEVTHSGWGGLRRVHGVRQLSLLVSRSNGFGVTIRLSPTCPGHERGGEDVLVTRLEVYATGRKTLSYCCGGKVLGNVYAQRLLARLSVMSTTAGIEGAVLYPPCRGWRKYESELQFPGGPQQIPTYRFSLRASTHPPRLSHSGLLSTPHFSFDPPASPCSFSLVPQTILAVNPQAMSRFIRTKPFGVFTYTKGGTLVL